MTFSRRSHQPPLYATPAVVTAGRGDGTAPTGSPPRARGGMARRPETGGQASTSSPGSCPKSTTAQGVIRENPSWTLNVLLHTGTRK
ncbi:hypothetical protein Aros01_06337 [Streptosporangium roseum]|uniref:Uncharacterized protein n=1 Tax=Streptosporangium roseum (strain ATCC 12428 / DSM 43021 / JCM 3005 / KCTC 9067 / NCIMB 10171 / NRRL 2505 / NI 9100) TaxID=479432 RepID=D2B5I6_STRRD|nr:hypothetical protein Sros_6782 [Streptosporangium roseum DSM 43021]